jgi:hypothetical protein
VKHKLVRDAMIDDERSKTDNDDGAVPALNIGILSPSPYLYENASLLEVSLSYTQCRGSGGVCVAKRILIDHYSQVLGALTSRRLKYRVSWIARVRSTSTYPFECSIAESSDIDHCKCRC